MALARIPFLPRGAGALSALTVLCEEVQAWADAAASFRPACLPFIHPGATQGASASRQLIAHWHWRGACWEAAGTQSTPGNLQTPPEPPGLLWAPSAWSGAAGAGEGTGLPVPTWGMPSSMSGHALWRSRVLPAGTARTRASSLWQHQQDPAELQGPRWESRERWKELRCVL